ncbi:MAG: DUF814 domain-containing protein [Acidobacteria bacterium]|nr:DUF814 domain-containing protein [Acidobacteriota bacterium]
MDILVLQRLATELDAKLRGARIDQVYALPKNDVVLVCGRRSEPRLWFSTEPDHPHLYERPGPHPAPKRPPGFAMAARRLLRGRRIAAVDVVPGERIVELRTAGDDAVRVVFELIPRRATALVVDHTARVRAAWQPRRGRPKVGELYVAPAADTRAAIEDLEADTWDTLSASPDNDALVGGLLRAIAGMSPLIAREIMARHRGGVPLSAAARTEVERAASEPTAPRIYSPVALDELASLPALPGVRTFLVAPFPMRHLEDGPEALRVTEFPTLDEAAATFYPLRATLKALETARRGLNSAVDGGIARLLRTLDAVSEDAAAAGDAEQHRRWADLLLAYPQTSRTGAIARVPDAFADGAPVEIPVDPARTLVDNAQVYYRRARRAERSAARTAARRRQLEGRVGALRRISSEVGSTRAVRDCRRLGKAATEQGVTITTGAWTIPEAPLSAEAAPAGAEPASLEAAGGSSTEPGSADPGRPKRRPGSAIDVFTSSDGFEILVGRNANANERVTFKLARPHDFWLHAEGPGSHVVIRNPGRSEEPSEAALCEAASLAAHFSSARGATKVNVRWTQVRHVRKPRKGPKGQVVLRRANTALAEPVPPERLFAAPATD